MKLTALPAKPAQPNRDWPIRLFNKSVLKQRKFREIESLLGNVEGLHCLDVGSDNGVISLLLRQKGGSWKSADLDENSVRAIRALVGNDVYQIDGGRTTFQDDEFDRVVIVDFLEHISDERRFLLELSRIMKPGGELILNVPHIKQGLLRKFRHAIGQTDEKHGHLRPGYTLQDLQALLGAEFSLLSWSTYSKFFSELVDALVVFAVSTLRSKKSQPEDSSKGLIVTGKDLKDYGSSFKLYSLIYPFVRAFSGLDRLLFFKSGYMLIAKVRLNKGAWKSS